MANIIQMERYAKRQPRADVAPSAVDALVARVEERLRASNPRIASGQWKLRKRDAQDRFDLVMLARNLHVMLDALPHGQKGAAIARAGFGGDNQSVYIENLTVPPTVTTVEPRRMQRLTPIVDRYLNVALAIEPDRKRAIASLFEGTSFDGPAAASGTTWADRMSGKLGEMARRLDREIGLGRLFDEMSSANVSLAEGAEFEPRLQHWLSETFHKIDFADNLAGAGAGEGFWLHDRNDELTPLCGAALFCPRIVIDRRRESWAFSLQGHDAIASGSKVAPPRTVIIDCQTELHLALVPIAETLDTPSRVQCWFLERPSAVFRDRAHGELYRLREEGGIFEMFSSQGRWEGARTDMQDGANGTALAQLIIERANGEGPDLTAGSWWCQPASPPVLEVVFSRPRATSLVPSNSPPEQSRVFYYPEEWAEVDRHAIDPAVFAPWGSIGAAVQEAMAAGLIEAELKRKAVAIGAAFSDLKRRLRNEFAGI